MNELAKQKCEPCRVGARALTQEDIKKYLEVIPEWELVTGEGISQLRRVFPFDDFAMALEFTNRVGAIAEHEGHHPALGTEWGKVTVNWWTHKIKGLHLNDFIMSTKTDSLYQEFLGTSE